MNDALDILNTLLSMPLDSSAGVMSMFAGLAGAISHQDGGKHNFVYVPGRRKDRVLLVAHADTVWDAFYIGAQAVATKPVWEDGVIRGENPNCGLGADDRAGCAMLYLLKDSGHSLLITDGEEHGQIGAKYIERAYPEVFDELNRHRYMIQLDRRGASVSRSRGAAGRGEGGHSTGKNMDCVAVFALRRKTRPGMPCFEYDGRPMKLT